MIIVSRNNIWSGTNYAINNYNEGQPIDLDYDDLFTTNPDEFVYWGSGPDRHMPDLDTFQTLTGQEPNGFNVEPCFADAGGGDYTLALESDLIDVGIAIPGINDGYTGSAPDIGAFEYQGCRGDFNGDGDVDGTDLAVFAAGGTDIALKALAHDFGQTDCPFRGVRPYGPEA